MALSGPEALKSLDDAIRDIRGEEDEIAKRLARAADRVSKLRENETELFRQLADIRLANDRRTEMSGRLIQAEERAHEMLAEHADDIRAAEAALKAFDTRVAGHARDRRKVLEDIDNAQAGLKALSARISQTSARDPAYEAKRTEAEKLAQIAAESFDKTGLAEADREQKGRPYREDLLFMYLWESGYGTRNYRANALVRALDVIVARMVGYADARINFAMLNEIPLRLREHADRQAVLARKAEAELDALEEAAIDAAGGKPLREALAAAQGRLAALDAEMAALEDERDGAANAYRQLAEGRSEKFEEASRILVESLAAQDVASLLADARMTATHEDDTIVAKIDDVRGRLAEEDQEAGDDQERLRTLATRRRELEDIEWEFKKSRFDDPRSVFREERLAGDLLGEFLRGAVTAAVYWDQWRKSQSWRPGTSDWGGGFGLPRSGRMGGWPSGGPWSSGGFSRPRTGARGSRRSGGFKTGGGF